MTEKERVIWAVCVWQMLRGMKEPAVENAWTNWIGHYWKNRVEGIPVPLLGAEASEMVEWAVWFKTSFPDVAERVYESPIPKRKHSILFEELSESDILVRHPGAVAHFALYLLRNRVIPLYDFDAIEKIVRGLKRFVEARSDLLEICQELAALGDPNASALREFIIENAQEADSS